jgi:hypothetical protein
VRRAGLGALLLALGLAGSVEAAVTRVEITRREPFAGGHAFEGALERERYILAEDVSRIVDEAMSQR